MKIKSATIKFNPGLASLFLMVFIVASIWLIFEYAEKERNRDLLNWQSRLALLAEIKATEVESWVDKRKKQLNTLSTNASLRLFLSEYNNSENVNKDVLSAVQGHVRNLLRSSAERFGFAENLSVISKLNINHASEYGLAILDKKQQLVMSTKGFPHDIEPHQNEIMSAYKSAKPQIIDLFAGAEGQPVYGFVYPVFQLQSLKDNSPVGAVVLLLDPRINLYEFLKNKQSITKSDESLLVVRDGPSVVHVSPVKGEFKLFHRLPDNNKHASSYAYHNSGGFEEMKDYSGVEVLVTGREIRNTPWHLVQKISAAEALAESNSHQIFLLTTFILFVVIIAIGFIAIWRHSTSLRLQSLSDALETHVDLLDAVTDNISDNIILLGGDLRVIFINHAFSQALSLDSNEIRSKHIASVLGKETSELLLENVSGKNEASVMSLQINASERIYHVVSTEVVYGEHVNAKLYVLHDISELKQEQEKRELLGRGIIGTLVKAVDMHDPFCANHSARTREVAMGIAKEMDLTEIQLESLEMAALLANIGKLFVPKEILTKMEVLSEEESDQLKMHIDYAVEILSGLSFNGPVVDIIAQKNERLDGSGYPKGLASSEIMLESRILAVANAFVAMASSRAYRKGRDVKDVIDMLLEQSETQYDRHVVAALFHISENKTDWKTWQSI